MGVQPAGGQHEGKLVIGNFTRLAVIARQEDGSAVGRRETAIQETPFRSRMVLVGTGPLQATELTQAGARHAGHVARPATRELDEFVPDLAGSWMIEAAKAQI